MLRFAANASLLVLILVLWPQIAPVFEILAYQHYFILFSFVVLTHFQCRILTVALSSHLLQKYSVGAYAAFTIAKLIGYLAVTGVMEFSLWTAFWVDLVAYALFYAGLKYFYETQPDHQVGEVTSLSRTERSRLLKYGAFYNFNDAGTLPLQARTDNFFIGGFLDPVAVGAYSFCTRLNDMVHRATPLRLLESVIQPLFFSLDHRADPKRVQTYFSLLLTLGLVVKIPILMFVTCYHAELVQVVFGGKFLEYSPLLIGVFLFSTLNSIDVPVTLVAQLKEKAYIILLSRIFGIYNIAANIILIPRIGVAGAVLATGTASLMKNLFIWWFVRDLARWKDATRFVLHSLLVWGAFTGLILFGAKTIVEQPLLSLSTGIVVWSACFILYVRSGALNAQQKRIVANVFPGSENGVLRLLGFAT